MSIYRCKMCGGDLSVVEGESYCTCEFCGTKQTIPTVTDEGLQNLFNRANLLRMKSEFDKAAEIYEKILQQSSTESEAYWGLILCKYGIEYVEDPATNKRIPTCHRTSYDAVTVDEDYKNALKYADTVQRGIYEEQAREIDRIQRGILDIVHKEKPYDVFICYKETDEAGKRTPDSVIANDIYHQLTMEGFIVFYAAITLEDKLGTEYEPYIFSALNTAKVMLAIGTKPEYFNAVWVKNEWSRFLKIMKNDRTRLLIPCYRDMDPYELPEEFAHLQAQDMSKIGFINDIVRGIKKVIVKESASPNNEKATAVDLKIPGTTADAQVQRGNMALEDHDWDKADSFFEEALNLDPKCAEAFLGKMLAREREIGFDSWISAQKEMYSTSKTESKQAFEEDYSHIKGIVQEYTIDGYLSEDTIRKLYEYDLGYDSAFSLRIDQKKKQLDEIYTDRLLGRARQFASSELKTKIEEGIAAISRVLEERVARAKEEDDKAAKRVTDGYAAHISEADEKVRELFEQAHARQEQDYQDAVSKLKKSNDVTSYEEAKKAFTSLKKYKDSEELSAKCQIEIDRCKEELRQEEVIKVKKQKKKMIWIALIFVITLVGFTVYYNILINNQYTAAISLMDEGKYEEAKSMFERMVDYKESKDYIFKSTLASAKKGDCITFGVFEQDNSTKSKEPIEWTVLDVQDGKSLIISNHVLIGLDMGSKDTDTTWANCNVRRWLNETFMSSFTSYESSYILQSTVNNKDGDTQDKVFILSWDEVKSYYPYKANRLVEATRWAIANGGWSLKARKNEGSKSHSEWWLRDSYEVYRYIDYDGEYDYKTFPDFESGVRPAMWLDTTKI